MLAWAWKLARLAVWLDRYVWDGFARFSAGLSQVAARWTACFDEGGINAAADQASERMSDFGARMSAWHSGHIQTYLRALGVSALGLLLLYLWMA